MIWVTIGQFLAAVGVGSSQKARPWRVSGPDTPHQTTTVDEVTVQATDPETIAIARWRDDLQHAGGKDSLIHFVDADNEALDLAYAHPSGLAQFLAGASTKLSNLFRQPSALITARRRTRAIRLTSSQLTDRHGIHTAYLVSGVAEWTSTHEATGEPLPVRAPIVLHPVTIRACGANGSDEELHMLDVPRVNPALLRLLASHDITVDDDALLKAAYGAHGFSPQPAYAQLVERTEALDDFTVADRTVMGVFFDGLPDLLADFDTWRPSMADHDVVSTLISRESSRTSDGDILPTDPPETPDVIGHIPDDELGLPLDVDQQTVLAAIRDGHDVRVLATPGSGATQLLAQIACDAATNNQRVLIASSRPRELTDLMARLSAIGVTGAIDDPGSIADTVITLPDDDSPAAAAVEPPSSAALLFDLIDRRHGLYQKTDPWGVSVSDVLDKLTVLTRSSTRPHTEVTLTADTLKGITGESYDTVKDMLIELSSQDGFASEARRSPWWAAMCASHNEAQAALQAARRLAEGPLAAYLDRTAQLAKDVGLTAPASLTECRQLVDLLGSVKKTLTYFVDELYQRPIDNMVSATADAAWRTERGITMGLGDRRRWRRQAKSFQRPGANIPDLHDALTTAMHERSRWQQMARNGGWPQRVTDLESVQALEQDVLPDVEILEAALQTTPQGAGLFEVLPTELADRVQALATDRLNDSLPERVTLTGQLAAYGLGELLTDLGERNVSSDTIEAEFELCYLNSLLAVLREELQLPSLDVDSANQWRIARDAEHSETCQRITSDLGATDEPPCVVVSTLRMPELLGEQQFDLVIVANAHSCAVPEGVLALARGAQVVVLGDPGGVAPRGLDESVDDAAVRDSLLDATTDVLPTWSLTHQHRMASQIAAVMPETPLWSVAAPKNDVHLKPVFARQSTSAAGATESSLIDREIKAVVQAVTSHISQHPTESLAVITLTRSHARAVADAVRQELLRNPTARDWLANHPADRFVVTDMYRCEDIVCDHIVLSVGLATSPEKSLDSLLAELDKPSADRAAGAVFGRARSRITVVSSVSGEDIRELVNPSPVSVVLSHALSVAENPSSGPTAPEKGLPPLVSDFAAAIGHAGFDVVTTGGAHGWPDLAVSKPGSAPVAVLIDARWPDRGDDDNDTDPVDTAAWVCDELLVAEHLQRFGWQVVSISMMDLFANESAAVRAVEEAAAGRNAAVVHIQDVSLEKAELEAKSTDSQVVR